MEITRDELSTSVQAILQDVKSKSLVKSDLNKVNLINDLIKTGETLSLDKSTAFKELSKLDLANEKSKNSLDISKGIEKLLGVSSEQFKSDIESRKKFYDAYRFIFRNFPQLNVALKVLTNQIVSPERITGDVLKIIQATGNLDETTFKEEKQIIEGILKRYKLNDKIFSYVGNALSDGECFLELIRTSSIKVNDEETGEILLESDTSQRKEFDILLEGFDENVTLSDKAEFERITRDKFEIGLYDDETTLLVESFLNDVENNLELKESDNVEDESKKDICYIKKHKPENVVKLQIDEVVLGYIIIKDIGKLNTSEKNFYESFLNNDSRKDKEKNNKNITETLTDFILNTIVGKIDKSTTKTMSKFLAKNQDLKNLVKIAVINDSKCNIRFVEKEYIQHFKNPSSTSDSEVYGESFINPMLLLIKHYFAILVANTNYNLSRSVERRMVKVEVGTDMDAESALVEVVKKLKQREEAVANTINSLEHSTTQISPTDDVYLPTINGEAPINFETIPSSQSSLDPEYLNTLKEEILKGVSIPRSLLNEYTNSYHTSLGQENFVFAFEVILYQNKFAPQILELVSKLNYLETNKLLVFKNAKVNFAPPTALMNEQKANELTNLETIINFIVTLTGDNMGNPKLNKLELAKKLSNHFDWSIIEKLLEKFKVDKAAEELNKTKTDDSGGF